MRPRPGPVTLIGATGAMGSGSLYYLKEGVFRDVAICDLAYDRDDDPVAVPTSSRISVHSQDASPRPVSRHRA